MYAYITGRPARLASIYILTHVAPWLEEGTSQGDLPTLIRFSGDLNALSHILTSWTAWSACGPFSCPFSLLPLAVVAPLATRHLPGLLFLLTWGFKWGLLELPVEILVARLLYPGYACLGLGSRPWVFLGLPGSTWVCLGLPGSAWLSQVPCYLFIYLLVARLRMEHLGHSCLPKHVPIGSIFCYLQGLLGCIVCQICFLGCR